MSFSADWLSARRDADRRARNPEIANLLAEYFGDQPRAKVLDLGCGTGANLAETSKLLPASQNWTMVDNDPELLSRVAPIDGIEIATRDADLAESLGDLIEPGHDLVTASALFDLAGAGFLQHLVDLVTGANAAFYTVLTYDGHETWSPHNPDDTAVLRAFHADQHTDKGLGPALGPDATQFIKSHFEAAGYSVHVAPSNWELGQPDDQRLIEMLASGIHDAVAADLGETAQYWFRDRRAASRVVIGHQDLLALPR